MQMNSTDDSFQDADTATDVASEEVNTFIEAVPPSISAIEIPDTTSKSNLEKMDHTTDIVRYLQRPVLLKKTSLTTTTAPLVDIGRFGTYYGVQQPYVVKLKLPHDLLRFKIDKMTGFKYLRADVRLRIETNIPPSVSGRLWIAYDPYSEDSKFYSNILNNSVTGITAFPGVEYDINTMTSAEIVIPFISFAEAYDITISPQYYVDLYVFCLTKVHDIETGTYPMLIYGQFENISLVGQTSALPHSSYLSRDEQLRRQLMTMNSDSLHKMVAEMQIQAEAKGSHNKKKGKPKGTAEQIANGVSAVAGKLKDVPIVGEIASSVGWVSDLVGGVCSFFGWSRPNTEEAPTKVLNVPGFGLTHYDGIDQGLVLGLTQANELDNSMPAMPSMIDEMTIDHFVANPSVIGRFNWKTGTPLLKNIPIGGRYSFKDKLTWNVNGPGEETFFSTTQEIFAFTPFQYVSNAFMMYRADFCYRVTVAKTAFHSGRLLFVYEPSIIELNAIDVDKYIGRNYTAILDLSTDSEITIKIPYLQKTNFHINVNDLFARLYIISLTDLLHTNTVDDNVDITVWTWAENTSFARPCMQVGKPIHLQNAETFVADMQINLNNKASRNIVVFNQGGNSSDNTTYLSQHAGEAIVNLRQLTRVHSKYQHAVKFAMNEDKIECFSFDPFTELSTHCGWLWYISNCYRFMRGGLSIKFVVYSDNPVMVEAVYGIAPAPIAVLNVPSNQPTHIVNSSINNVLEVRLPHYSIFSRKKINNKVNYDKEDQFNKINLFFRTINGKDANVRLEIFMAGNDDFNVGMLVGPPLIGDFCYISTNVNPTPRIDYSSEEKMDYRQFRIGPDYI
nr:MAG: structural polyprotein [Dicistroviridae sp.]